MCGICGKVYFDPQRLAERHVLSSMAESIRHRGPDDTGLYLRGPVGLGSTRLSIIDLEGGHMPISNEDGSVWIVYNGEVYNFQSLRERLERAGHRFASRTDTETIVHLYEEEGEDFVRYLNGMFALAIWDERQQRLILARDQLGIKPLFYSCQADRLVFGSEIKTFWCDGLERQLDPVALHDYLSLNYVPGPRTIFQGIFKLQPGHILVAYPKTGKAEVRKYWELPAAPPDRHHERSLPDLESELLDLLRVAVRDTMVSDVPVGAFLSGGIDSSIVVALMSEVSSHPVRTFSVGFAEESYNELPYARLIAARYKTDHHELLLDPPTADSVVRMIDYFDEPFADNSAVAVYAVSRLAVRHVKVVLTGEGGDEMFGGYMTYQADQLAGLYRRLPAALGHELIPKLVRLLPTSFKKGSFDFKLKKFVSGASLPPLEAHYMWKANLEEQIKSSLYSKDWLNGELASLRPTVALLRDYYDGYGVNDTLNRLLFVDYKVQLVDDMLTKVDRTSMAHSLEARVPLLDQRIVNFMSLLPSQRKVRGLALKYLLKRAVKKLLPREILERSKAGFSIPVAPWMASELKEMLTEELSASRLKAQGIFDPQAVGKMVEAHLQGKQDFSRPLWALFVFNLWYGRHFAGQAAGFAYAQAGSGQ